MIDCSLTKNYFAEKVKMTNDCRIECENCPLHSPNNGTDDYCVQFEGRFTDRAIDIVQKWSDKHPVKTRLMDFIEKFPNATFENGYPVNCYPCRLGYCKRCVDTCSLNYKRCWNTLLEDKR